MVLAVLDDDDDIFGVAHFSACLPGKTACCCCVNEIGILQSCYGQFASNVFCTSKQASQDLAKIDRFASMTRIFLFFLLIPHYKTFYFRKSNCFLLNIS